MSLINNAPTCSSILPRQLILQKFYLMLDEDVGFGDITTSSLIPPEQNAHAILFTKTPGVIAGIEIAKIILADFDCTVDVHQVDGTFVKAKTTLLEARGCAATLLTIERTLLNLLQRMCGIATATAELVNKARQVNSNIRIAATRKTAPLLRFFDKRAVIIGGGDPHRWRLDDAILIKDNHLAFYNDINKAIQRARKQASFSCPIEIEVTTLPAALDAAKAGVDAILLDNMSPQEVSMTLKKINELKLEKNPILEVSGNITPSNIDSYAKTGVDIISVGWITHSVRALDLSFDITPNQKLSLHGG